MAIGGRLSGGRSVVWVRGLAALAFALIGLVGFSGQASATAIIVVDSTGDGGDANLSDGVCATSGGDCTLRAAIETANFQPGSDVINFAIPGTGVHTIRPRTELPAIDDSTGWLLLDGYTQPGATPNTAAQGSNATIRIQIRGNEQWGLRVLSAENTIRGLAIGGFQSNIEVNFDTADGNLIAGNFVGLDASGRRVSGTKYGIRLRSGPDRNRIGTADLADRNVVSGNEWGITIEHGITSENLVQNNVIGLRPGLDNREQQSGGVDIQWGSWGNMIGGFNPGEGNLISGNKNQGDWRGGIDLSHDAVDNLVVGNNIGTLGDGDSASSYSENRYGMVIKDNAHRNYIADNVIANSQLDGIGMRHNFNGPSVYVENRIGVGRAGASLPNGETGVSLNGHDDLLYDNIIANNDDGGVSVIDLTFNDEGTNHPPEKTLGNRLLYNTFYSNGGGLAVDITPLGRPNRNDSGDRDNGPHRELNHPEFTGLGAGEVYGTACAGCQVQIYLSGAVASDGSVDLSRNDGRIGAAWLGTAAADQGGRFSLADGRIAVGRTLWALAIDDEGNTSEWTVGGINVPSTPFGIGGNPQPSLAREPRPAIPRLPEPHVPVLPDRFTCSHDGFTLSWADAGADEYYVFAFVNGESQYLGAQTGTSIATPPADGFQVSHFRHGQAVTAECGRSIGGPPLGNCTSIDFADRPILRFGGQDNGSATVVDEGAGLQVFRNGWKAIDLDHEVLANTMLEFDFRSGVQGEEHAIGFSNVLRDAATGQRFKLYGTQDTRGDAIQDFHNYPGGGVVQRVVIPVGIYLRGDFNYLLFTADDDARAAGESVFSNILLYDGDDASVCDPTPPPPPPERAEIGGLVSADGSPRAGLVVDLFVQAADGSRGAYLTSTQTGQDGRYQFGDLDGRCYVVTFIGSDDEQFSNGSRWLSTPLCVEAGEARTDVDATLDGPSPVSATLAGRTLFNSGEPAAGVTAVLYRLNADGSRGQYMTEVDSGSDGTYQFGVDPGCYWIDLVAPAGTSFDGRAYFQHRACVEDGQTTGGLDATLSRAG